MVQKIAVARQNVMVDGLCFGVLETDAGGVVEATLGLNPGVSGTLRKTGHRLALEQVVLLPEPEAATRVVHQVTLWN